MCVFRGLHNILWTLFVLIYRKRGNVAQTAADSHVLTSTMRIGARPPKFWKHLVVRGGPGQMRMGLGWWVGYYSSMYLGELS